jgi:tetratricopeptide (TPR) repeat protein
MESTLRHLSSLSSAGNPAAMVVHGRVLEREGKKEQALRLFQKATETEWGEDHEFESGVASAWLSLGWLKLKSNDSTGGEAALKKGADLNDARAAFHFALTQPPERKDYHTYMLKAAVSGIASAQHNIGVFYLQQASANRTASYFRQMAREWFALAATEKFAPSQLNFALMLKHEGKASEGLEWLDRAQRNPAFEAEAARVKERWRDGHVRFDDSGKIAIT